MTIAEPNSERVSEIWLTLRIFINITLILLIIAVYLKKYWLSFYNFITIAPVFPQKKNNIPSQIDNNPTILILSFQPLHDHYLSHTLSSKIFYHIPYGSKRKKKEKENYKNLTYRQN